MLKTILALVELRQDISEFIQSLIELGGDDDSFDYFLASYQKLRVEKCKGHHVNQIKDTVNETVERRQFRYNIIFSDGDPDGNVCMNCGNSDKEGYFKRIKVCACEINQGVLTIMVMDVSYNGT